MALKRKITKADFEALDDGVKSLYKQDGDNYILDLEPDAAFDSLKQEKAALAEKLREKEEAETRAAEEARKEREKAAKAAGDVEALEKSWKEKYERDLAAEREKTATSTKALEAVFVNKVARDIAEKISTVPDLLVDRIKARLTVETNGSQPITRVVDANGQPSALSITDLEKEFVDNPAYKAIIKASSAQGGGAGEGGDGDGVPTKKLSEMTATEEAKFANEHPEQYARMVGNT